MAVDKKQKMNLQARALPPSSIGFPSVSPIDLAALHRNTWNDRVLERELLALFASEAPLSLDRLRRAISAEDWRFAAHSLKGASLAVGASRLARLAEAAETFDVTSKARAEATAKIKAALDVTIIFIREFLRSPA